MKIPDETGRSAPAIDQKGMWETFDDDRELAREMAELFAASAYGHLDALHASTAAGDVETAQRTAHTLKGLFATFHAEAAREAAWQVERLARGGDLQAAAAATPRLREEMDRVVHELAELIRELAKPAGA
jgi:HPt (histidine-containing phosphotransfer) domain-containing protein